MENLTLSILQYILVVLTIIFIWKIVIWYPTRRTTTLSCLWMCMWKIFVLWIATGPVIYLLRKFLIHINFLTPTIDDCFAWYINNIFFQLFGIGVKI